MSDRYGLQRFVDAQDPVFSTVLEELRQGSKRTHWMWFIFPQLEGLGFSETAKFYALASAEEAQAYLKHPLLGPRLLACLEALLSLQTNRSAEEIFGAVDALKLRSSLTLFNEVQRQSVFQNALDLFYQGQPDERTLALLNAKA